MSLGTQGFVDVILKRFFFQLNLFNHTNFLRKMGSSNFTYERPWIVCGFPKVTSLITELDWIQFYL